MDTDNNINDLLARPLWQLSGREYCALMRYVLSPESTPSSGTESPRQAIGMQHLAKALGCSASLLYGIRREVDFGPGVISHIGRREVFDVEAIRVLADGYMTRMRKDRRREEA